jgi:hypothetical protein
VILTITEESGFTWLVEPKGGEPRTIQGTLDVDGDALLLDSPEEGAMTGSAVVKGPHSFSFVLQGGPPGDPGLSFQRRGEPRGPATDLREGGDATEPQPETEAKPEPPAPVPQPEGTPADKGDQPEAVDAKKVVEEELQPELPPPPDTPTEAPQSGAPND